MTSNETLWIARNTQMLEKKYSGKYIAVAGNQVVASGRSVKEVFRTVDRKRIERPLITYVPRKGEEILLI